MIGTEGYGFNELSIRMARACVLQ